MKQTFNQVTLFEEDNLDCLTAKNIGEKFYTGDQDYHNIMS